MTYLSARTHIVSQHDRASIKPTTLINGTGILNLHPQLQQSPLLEQTVTPTSILIAYLSAPFSDGLTA